MDCVVPMECVSRLIFPVSENHMAISLFAPEKIFDAFFDGAGEIAGYPLGLFFTSSFLVYLVMNEFATRGFRLNEELHPIMVEYKNISHYPFFYTPRIIMPFYERGVAAMEKLAGMLKGAQEKSLLLRPVNFV